MQLFFFQKNEDQKKMLEDCVRIKIIIEQFSIKFFYYNELDDWFNLFSKDIFEINPKLSDKDILSIYKNEKELIISNKKNNFLFTFPLEDVIKEITETYNWFVENCY